MLLLLRLEDTPSDSWNLLVNMVGLEDGCLLLERTLRCPFHVLFLLVLLSIFSFVEGIDAPSSSPTSIPSLVPSIVPSCLPTRVPSNTPSSIPSRCPSRFPSSVPSTIPSTSPSSFPTQLPSCHPSIHPSSMPSSIPSSVAVAPIACRHHQRRRTGVVFCR